MCKGRWLHPKAETEGLFVSVELCVLFTGFFTASRFRRTGGFRFAFSRAALRGRPSAEAKNKLSSFADLRQRMTFSFLQH